MTNKKQQAKKHKTKKSPPEEPAPRKEWDVKFWIAFVIALILGAIQLRPKPIASLDTPLDPRDVLTTPIVIVNGGDLPLSNVSVTCFELATFSEGRGFGHDNLAEDYVLPSKTLNWGEAKTVPLYHFFAPGNKIESDILLVVSYQMEYVPFFHRKKAFLFRTVKQADGNLRFVQEPAEEAFEHFNKEYERIKTGRDPAK